MEMVGHQSVDGTQEPLADGSMQCDFAKALMKVLVQPAGRAILHCVRPQNHGGAAIGFRRKSREVAPGVSKCLGHTTASLPRLLPTAIVPPTQNPGNPAA